MPVPQLHSTNDTIDGSSYEEHVKRFWEHYLEIPLASNPFYVPEICETALRPSDSVFYLPLYLGKSTKRDCRTKAGKRIFIPIIGVVVLPHEVDPPRVARQRTVARRDQDCVKEMNLEISIDKSILQLSTGDLMKFRIRTGAFDATLPSGGMYDAPEGDTKCVADGFYVITKPIERGEYVIKFSGMLNCTGPDCVPNEKNFESKSTINLHIR